MNGWQTMSLKEAEVSLIDCVHKTPASVSVGFPYVAIPQMKSGHIDFSGARQISDLDLQEWTRKAKPQKYDVILSRRTNPGVTAVDNSGTQFALGQNLVLLRANSKSVCPEFLRWLCLSPAWWEQVEKFINVGAVFSSLRCGDVPKFELPLPPLPEQREIAATLGALDDKIELNRKTAATLEEMARVLYRSWFVDFDPVHAKAEGRAPAHMDAQTAALFPDRFAENGLPEGWRIGTLGDLVEFNPKERIGKGAIAPYLDMKALPTEGMISAPPVLRAFSSGTKFKDGDTLLARITPCLENGKTTLVSGLGDKVVGWGSTEFIVMRPRHGVPVSLPYCVARDQLFRDEAIGTMTGSSGRQRADEKRISMMDFVLPDDQSLKSFAFQTMRLIEKIYVLGRENQTLAALRDTLLPRLMSGELRVPAARKLVEEAL